MAKKKGKNPRAAFLSAFMKRLSGAAGESAIAAYTKGDPDKLKAAMSKIVGNLAADLNTSTSGSTMVFRGKKLVSTSDVQDDEEVVLLERKKVV